MPSGQPKVSQTLPKAPQSVFSTPRGRDVLLHNPTGLLSTTPKIHRQDCSAFQKRDQPCLPRERGRRFAEVRASGDEGDWLRSVLITSGISEMILKLAIQTNTADWLYARMCRTLSKFHLCACNSKLASRTEEISSQIVDEAGRFDRIN